MKRYAKMLAAGGVVNVAFDMPTLDGQDSTIRALWAKSATAGSP